MTTSDSPVLRDLVLVGGGHAHVVALRRFGMRPMPGVRITVVCRDVETPYSGMLPGYIAGHYAYDEIHIDVARLAAFAGARFYRDEAIGIDRARKTVICRSRPPVAYDLLSIDIGSTPQTDGVEGAQAHAVPVKPIDTFNARWLALLARVRSRSGALRIAVVGGGAAGVELALAIQHRLANELRALGRDPAALALHLVEAGPEILPTHAGAVRRALLREPCARAIAVHVGAEVRRIEPGRLYTAAGETIAADEVVWATRARGAPWLAQTGLALDDDGFIRVDATLRSVTDPHVFAAGDVASIEGHRLEKAGVYAVRMGPPLAENLRRALEGRPLVRYRPQRRFLSLIGTGARTAVASRGPFRASGAWVWRWKERIDRRFMAQFSGLSPMRASAPARPALALAPEEGIEAAQASAMRCGGCGAKVGAGALARALAAIGPRARAEVLVGLQTPDDAAVLRVPDGKALVHSVDFFRAPLDDPYRFGKIAANHALGDIYAMGGEPLAATAIVTLPPGLEAKVEDTLFQLLAGAVEVLDEAGCALVGGHSAEGRELALGFAVNGLVDEHLRGLLRKRGMQPGDALVLTKPIGTGTLLAAHARLAARGRWVEAAIEAMCQSSRRAARTLVAHGARACTDVTGFGLLGHLLEMVEPSGVAAELRLGALPLLEGAQETAAAGLLSSLQPANLRFARALAAPPALAAHPRRALLFDPQTAGGLLAALPAARADDCVAQLRAEGYDRAAIVGRVLARAQAAAPVVLAD
ncbi:MAG: selenide, water dikinase SelD [Burkholderiales bacterium]|nr:selenide, water dikinase SelD [Burkholderiales bacterium]